MQKIDGDYRVERSALPAFIGRSSLPEWAKDTCASFFNRMERSISFLNLIFQGIIFLLGCLLTVLVFVPVILIGFVVFLFLWPIGLGEMGHFIKTYWTNVIEFVAPVIGFGIAAIVPAIVWIGGFLLSVPLALFSTIFFDLPRILWQMNVDTKAEADRKMFIENHIHLIEPCEEFEAFEALPDYPFELITPVPKSFFGLGFLSAGAEVQCTGTECHCKMTPECEERVTEYRQLTREERYDGISPVTVNVSVSRMKAYRKEHPLRTDRLCITDTDAEYGRRSNQAFMSHLQSSAAMHRFFSFHTMYENYTHSKFLGKPMVVAKRSLTAKSAIEIFETREEAKTGRDTSGHLVAPYPRDVLACMLKLLDKEKERVVELPDGEEEESFAMSASSSFSA